MRCQNCGWSNPDGASLCEKCKQPLDVIQSNNATSREHEQYQPIQESIRKTIRESRPYGGEEKQSVQEQEGFCPKCGYPVVPGSGFCPSCGSELSSASISNTPQPKRSIPRNATINPWARRDNYCSLSPIDWNGQVIANAGHKEEFQDQALLTRENTMPENKTITSKEQAELVFKDGHWTIVDKSEQHTTFVLASREIELQNGDIVMLGNQLFRFNDGNAK